MARRRSQKPAHDDDKDSPWVFLGVQVFSLFALWATAECVRELDRRKRDRDLMKHCREETRRKLGSFRDPWGRLEILIEEEIKSPARLLLFPQWTDSVLSMIRIGDLFSEGKVYDKLQKFESLGRICLLEMVAWKHVCLVRGDNYCTDFLDWHRWWKEGWKTIKSEMRCSSELNVILERVVPSMEQPDEPAYLIVDLSPKV